MWAESPKRIGDKKEVLSNLNTPPTWYLRPPLPVFSLIFRLVFNCSWYNYTGQLSRNSDEASGFDLPDISGSGYAWDISNFTTNGTIAIVLVPEPSRLLLLGLTTGITLFRRRS